MAVAGIVLGWVGIGTLVATILLVVAASSAHHIEVMTPWG
jgi:hypothetical protein